MHMTRWTSLLCIGPLVAAGCSSSPWPARSHLTPAQEERLVQIAEREMEVRAAAETSFSGKTWMLGSIPYNARVLPLVSPDGRHIATSVGQPPSSATMYAAPNGAVPTETGIEIWELIPSYGGVRLQTELGSGLLLGTSADAEGFIVEKPNTNGSRWIGKVDWATGALTWLVQDDAVNAFGALGREGRLAWCTRSVDDHTFSLAMRFPDGEEFGIGGDVDWLLPEWSHYSDRLSAYALAPDGLLKIVSMDATGPGTLASSARDLPVMTGASRWDAAKASEYRNAVLGAQQALFDEVIFYHPVNKRVTVWLPTGIRSDAPVSLAAHSIAAVHDDRGDFLLTTPDGLHWQDANKLGHVIRVDHATVFARPTSNPMRPFILLDPGQHVVHLRAMRPDHNDEAAASADDNEG